MERSLAAWRSVNPFRAPRELTPEQREANAPSPRVGYAFAGLRRLVLTGVSLSYVAAMVCGRQPYRKASAAAPAWYCSEPTERERIHAAIRNTCSGKISSKVFIIECEDHPIRLNMPVDRIYGRDRSIVGDAW